MLHVNGDRTITRRSIAACSPENSFSIPNCSKTANTSRRGSFVA